MNLQAPPPGPPPRPAPRLDQLDPVETQALRLLRMWSWGAVHRETLALAAATQYGTAQGLCVVGAFESLFARLEATAVPPLSIRQPDSTRLDPDELWFLALVAAARSHGPHALRPRAAGRIAAGTEAALADSLHGFVSTLTACLRGKARPRTLPCPTACPMHPDCNDSTKRPALKVVE